jgi:hypothetical protein
LEEIDDPPEEDFLGVSARLAITQRWPTSRY